MDLQLFLLQSFSISPVYSFYFVPCLFIHFFLSTELQTLFVLSNDYFPGSPAQIKFCQVGTDCTYGQKLTFNTMLSSWNPKIQHDGTWLVAAWPTRCLCYSPTVFFPQLRLIAFPSPKNKFSLHLKNVIIYFLTFFQAAYTLNCLNCKWTSR